MINDKTISISRNKIIAVAILIIVGFIGGFFASRVLFGSKISVGEVKRIIRESDELTTIIIEERGKSPYDDKGLPILNRGNFTATYVAEIRIGINLSKVRVKRVDNVEKRIYVSIPKSKIQSVKIDPKTIKFSKKKFALFNFDQREDVIRFEKNLEKQLMNNTKNKEYKKADKQAKVLIRGIITAGAPRYEVVFI